jgi:hypothetical protein
MHESFLVYERFRYLKLSFWLVVAAIIAYAIHSPPDPPNGGTWLGYTLGTIGALIILLLLWLGVRKRKFRSKMGKVQGWVSAHVYLGTSLLIVATLHSGFQFAWNVHTLAYVLMVAVILSGFYGIYAYLRFPDMVTDNRRGLSQEQMIAEIDEVDKESLVLSDRISGEIHQIVLESVEGTCAGGGVRAQLAGKSSTAATAAVEKLAEKLAQTSDAEQSNRLRGVIELLRRKSSLLDRLTRDIRYRAIMDVWLYIHVPLSVALLGALLTHIVAVFFYW